MFSHFFSFPLVQLLVDVLPLLQLPAAAQLLQQQLSVLVQLLDGLLRLLAGHPRYVELTSRGFPARHRRLPAPSHRRLQLLLHFVADLQLPNRALARPGWGFADTPTVSRVQHVVHYRERVLALRPLQFVVELVPVEALNLATGLQALVPRPVCWIV